MIRLAALLCVLATPTFAQTTPLTDRPGRWVSVPQGQGASVPTQPQVEPQAVLPEVVAPRIAVPAARVPGPDTLRPAQRPGVAPLRAVEAPDVALDVRPVEDAATIAPPTPRDLAVQPVQRPAEVDAAALATELADALAADALDIATAPVAAVPVVEAPSVARFEIPEAPATPRPTPATPVVPVALTVSPAVTAPARPPMMAAVLIAPSDALLARAADIAALARPGPDLPPVASRPRPPAPSTQAELTQPRAVLAAPLSAVLMPGETQRPAPVPGLQLAAFPAPDPFPYSALPPSALPNGPEALEQAAPPPPQQPERMAAVLIAPFPEGSDRIVPPDALVRPSRDEAFVSPEAPVQLPAPDPNALARLVEETIYCWRLAGLGPEARWAEIAVDVALDETNHASAGSIRLTGFSRVLSSAAEEAYRAAHSALMGCGAASAAEPVTAAATLIFDRDGVHLR